MSKVTKFKIGDKVSHKNRGWKGVIIDFKEYPNSCGFTWVVVPMITYMNRPQRERFVKTLHPFWLRKVEFDDKLIKQNWL